jgi:DNA-binding CsgD family transcriptional regulator
MPRDGCINALCSSVLMILESIGCGGLVVESSGDIIAKNPCADRILGRMFRAIAKERSGIRLPQSLLTALNTKPRQPAFLDIDKARPIVVHNFPAHMSSGHVILVIVDLNEFKPPKTGILHAGFKLTRCEARLAVALSTGLTLKEIAKVYGVGIGTLRGQLKSIFAKTATTRQPELVALLARMVIAAE